MEITLAEAATAVNMTKPGLLKAIKTGRLSAVKDANGTWKLDTAELFRVYQPANRKVDPAEAELVPEHTELAVTKAKLAAAEAMIDELRRARDAWQAQAERLALTTTQAPQAQAYQESPSNRPVEASEVEKRPGGHAEVETGKKRGFWRRLFS